MILAWLKSNDFQTPVFSPHLCYSSAFYCKQEPSFLPQKLFCLLSLIPSLTHIFTWFCAQRLICKWKTHVGAHTRTHAHTRAHTHAHAHTHTGLSPLPPRTWVVSKACGSALTSEVLLFCCCWVILVMARWRWRIAVVVLGVQEALEGSTSCYTHAHRLSGLEGVLKVI